MKWKWIAIIPALGLLAAPLTFQPAEASSKQVSVQEDKLPIHLAQLMNIAPEHQFTLRRGSQQIEVELLQWTLNQYGLELSIDGTFGPQTDKAVRQYQTDKGLGADGIVGVNTWVALYAEHKEPADQEGKLPAHLAQLMNIAPEHQFTLRKGSERVEVELLQWTLNQYGLELSIDGIYGSQTDQAVRQYQADKGLKVDGIVGMYTWVAIYAEH